MVKNDSVKVTYYLSSEEYDHLKSMAEFLCEEDAIPRPTVGTFSRAAVLKMFRELSILRAKQ